MHTLLRLCPLLLLLTATAASAQSFTIDVSPAVQTVQVGQSATYTITALPEGGFGASVFLRVIAPSLNPAAIALDNATINAPYTTGATVSTTPIGNDVGVHTIVVEGKNGGMVRYDTVRLTVTSNPGANHWVLHHTGNSGLQSMNITAIDFDKTGAAWIGTNRGLSRALPGEAPQRVSGPYENSEIEAIGVDSAGGVWIAGDLPMNAVSRYFNGEWTPYPTPELFEHGVASITAIAGAPDGSVWFAGNGGLARFKDDLLQGFTPNDWGGTIGNDFMDLAVIPNGEVWASSRRGDGFLKFDGTFWTAFSVEELGGMRMTRLGELAVGNSGQIWTMMLKLQEGVGLIRPGGSDTTLRPVPFGGEKIAAARDGRIWISTGLSGRQLAVEEGDSWREFDMAYSGLPERPWITALAAHNNGSVWIGTRDNGLAVLQPARGTVGIAKDRATAVSGGRIALIPNPLGAKGTLQLVTRGGSATITLHDNLGARMAVLFEGILQPGEQSLAIDLSTVPSGSYVVTVAIDGQAPSSRMIMVMR